MADEVVAEPAAPDTTTSRTHHAREVIVGILVVISCLAFTVATPAVWAKRNFLDTDRFVSRAAPIASDPKVQVALADRLTQEIASIIDPAKLFEQVLPDRGQALAVPLASALTGFVHDKVLEFVQSDQFAQLWSDAVRTAHQTAVAILNGEHPPFVVTRNGVVSLDVIPMVNTILAAINKASPDLFGRDIQFPEIKSTDDPDSAISKLSTALDRPLPKDFGLIEVYDRNQLDAVQEGLHLFDRFVVVLVVVALVCAVAAMTITRRRRRTLVWLSVGVILGMVLLRRASFRIQDDVVALPPTAGGQDVAGVVLSSFLDPLTTFALWAAVVALVVLVVAYLTSDNPRAVSLRERVRQIAVKMGTRGGGQEVTADTGAVVWAQQHVDLLRAGGIVVALAILWLTDLSWLGVLLVLVLTASYEFGVQRVAAPSS